MKKIAQLLPFLLFIFISACQQTSIVADRQAQLLQNAYQSQYEMVSEQKNKSIIGYKAGLTSKAGQKKFAVSEPVAGVLFADGLSRDRQAYLLADHKKLMLETEIGFILKQDIPHFSTFPNKQQLSAFIERVVPVIELPDLAFDDLSKVSGFDLIKANVAANKVLIGKGLPINDIQLDTVVTQLVKNGQLVIEGHANDAMGDQLAALSWLIQTLQAAGYQPQKGDLLITGALGKMIVAERGQYDADFGPLGQLAFSIR